MIQTIFTVVPFMVCLFWTTVFLLDWRHTYRAKHVLTVFMGICTILYFCHALYFNEPSSYHPMVDSIYTLCNLAVFPMYYLYICKLTQTEINKRRHIILMAPAAVITLWAIGLYCIEVPTSYHITRIVTMRVVFLIQVIWVCWFGFKSLKEFDRHIENFYSDTSFRQTKQTRYMMLALLVCALASVTANILGRDYFCEHPSMLALPSGIFGVLLFGIGYVGDRQNFSIDDVQTDLKSAGNGYDDLDSIGGSDEKLGKCASNPSLISELETLILSEKKYLNPDLKLPDIVHDLAVGRTQLSTLINQTFGLSFSEYINSYRIRHAVELMEQNPTESMERIAEMSGFTNNATFYRAFRKHMGTTPKKWLQEHEN